MGTRGRVDTSPAAQGCPRGLKLRVQYESHTPIGDLCESEPRAFSSERTASLSIHSSLLLAGGPSDSFHGIRDFGRRSFSMIWVTYSVLTWTGRRAKSTSISERGLWVCCLAIGG